MLQSYTPPNLPRLLSALDSAGVAASGDLTPILLCAPAGYGKTKLISAWLKSTEATGVARLRCLPGSSESFWSDLALTVTRALGMTELPSDAPGALPRLLARLEQPLTLVIDDYHLATTPKNDLALLDLVGPQLRLVVVARRVCILDGPLAARRVPMLLITLDDLALTPEEAAAHARARFQAADTPAAAAALEMAAGWPLAIRAAFAASASSSQTHDTAVTLLDPLAALTRFAHQQLESVDAFPGRLLAAASLIDILDLPQADRLLHEDSDGDPAPAGASTPPRLHDGTAIREAIDHLLELGLLIPAPSGDTEEFSCHPAVAHGVADRADRLLSDAERTDLFTRRAEKLAPTAPVTAFNMYLAALAYTDAESLLEQHFTTITDEVALASQALRPLPKDILKLHPIFIAARMFLELPHPHASSSAIDYLLALWIQSLKPHLEAPAAVVDASAPYFAQAMVAARMNGDIATAARISHELEALVDPLHFVGTPPPQIEAAGDPETRGMLGRGALAVLFRELATTATLAGEFGRAQRMWERLMQHSERLIARPWNGFPYSSTRTLTDADSGRRWKLAALSELALTKVVTGDLVRADELVREADALATEIDSRGPGLSWLSREIARAHLSYETDQPALLPSAVAAVTPFASRSEHSPLLLHARADAAAAARGPEWALPVLDAGAVARGHSMRGRGNSMPRTRPRRGSAWAPFLTAQHARLSTVTGRFPDADRLLEQLPEDLVATRIEHARRALFDGDDVRALLLAQAICDDESTLREQVHRRLIIACAAWNCAETAIAVETLRSAVTRIIRSGLRSPLHAVPHATLQEIVAAVEADRSVPDAGAFCRDARELIDAVPEPARAKRYERLTEMELRTLAVIARERTIANAAETLFITPATVKKHLNSVYRKLHVRGRDEALLQAGYMGLLSFD